MIRIRYIDSLRGMAILFMILAHTVPNDPKAFEEVNFIIRLLSSLAAPLFLFLVGFNFRPKEKFDTSSIKKMKQDQQIHMKWLENYKSILKI